jgi:NAD+ synthase
MSIDEISTWIREQVAEAGKSGVVIGLSGGVDSALCYALAVRGCGERGVDGFFLPFGGTPDYWDSIVKLRDTFGGWVRCDGLALTLRTYESAYSFKDKMARGNLMARLRMMHLYNKAYEHDALVIGTSNACELYMGYYTKWGDGACDIAPISHLTKSQVYTMAREIGVPKEIINRPPSADLWQGQTDEGEMGLTYDEIEAMMKFDEVAKSEKYAKFTKLRDCNRHKGIGVKRFNG